MINATAVSSNVTFKVMLKSVFPPSVHDDVNSSKLEEVLCRKGSSPNNYELQGNVRAAYNCAFN